MLSFKERLFQQIEEYLGLMGCDCAHYGDDSREGTGILYMFKRDGRNAFGKIIYSWDKWTFSMDVHIDGHSVLPAGKQVSAAPENSTNFWQVLHSALVDHHMFWLEPKFIPLVKNGFRPMCGNGAASWFKEMSQGGGVTIKYSYRDKHKDRDAYDVEYAGSDNRILRQKMGLVALGEAMNHGLALVEETSDLVAELVH